MSDEMESLQANDGPVRRQRRRLHLKDEFTLALLPTGTVLAVFGLMEIFTQQRLLFASLASSAFLIYMDPEHGTNTTRTLVVSHISAAIFGWIIFFLAGPGYLAGGLAMVLTIIVMILADAVHPPAVSTALSFALRAGNEENLVLFMLAVVIITLLVGLQRAAIWLLARYTARSG